MPGSANEGKPLIVDVLKRLKSNGSMKSIVDIGPGRGKFAHILRPELNDVSFCAVEVWGPYVREFSLEKIYDKIIVADVRYISWEKIGRADAVIFGDVLEHMTRAEALSVYGSAGKACKFMVISIPVSECHQEEVYGNPFEAHVEENWTHESVMSTFPGIVFSAVATRPKDNLSLGVYFAAFDIENQRLLESIARAISGAPPGQA